MKASLVSTAASILAFGIALGAPAGLAIDDAAARPVAVPVRSRSAITVCRMKYLKMPEPSEIRNRITA